MTALEILTRSDMVWETAINALLIILGALYIIQTEVRLWKLEDELTSISFPEYGQRSPGGEPARKDPTDSSAELPGVTPS